jgi:hypothetical protein
MPRIPQIRFLGTSGGAEPTAYTLTVDAASLVLTGQSISLNRAVTLAVTAGALTLTGQTIGMSRGYTLTVSPASLVVTGQTVGMQLGRVLTVDAASLVLAGQTIGMDVTTAGAYTLTVEPASLVLTGQSLGMSVGRVLTVAPASLVLTGGTVGMTYTPASAAVTCDVWSCVLEATPFGDITAGDALRIILAALAGKLTGADGTTISIRDMMDSKNRIVATVDSSGNRTAITTLDGSV